MNGCFFTKSLRDTMMKLFYQKRTKTGKILGKRIGEFIVQFSCLLEYELQEMKADQCFSVLIVIVFNDQKFNNYPIYVYINFYCYLLGSIKSLRKIVWKTNSIVNIIKFWLERPRAFHANLVITKKNWRGHYSSLYWFVWIRTSRLLWTRKDI